MDRMKVGVVSDTHAPRRWRTCPPAVAVALSDVDVILHAGDICVPGVLDELAEFAPVHVVRGNNDGPDIEAPETLQLTLDGLTVAMIHDSGPKAGRALRLHRMFPDAGLVVFGHSHIPLNEDGIFNPGSPTDRRRQPRGTIGLLEIAGGILLSARIVPVT